jgi:hypothetical protein
MTCLLIRGECEGAETAFAVENPFALGSMLGNILIQNRRTKGAAA